MPILRKGSLALLSQSRFLLKIGDQASLYAFVPREISVPTELALGHLRCCLTDMPPQPNSPSGRCLETRLGERASDNSRAKRDETLSDATRRPHAPLGALRFTAARSRATSPIKQQSWRRAPSLECQRRANAAPHASADTPSRDSGRNHPHAPRRRYAVPVTGRAQPLVSSFDK